MTKAILLGSIGAVCETSQIQRQAYNQALEDAGLDWHWDVETYKELLVAVGGKERLSLLSRATASGLSTETIDRIHATKTDIATSRVRKEKPPLRPGVAALVRTAGARGLTRGFVTTTYRPNVDAINEAHADLFGEYPFDAIVTKHDVAKGKPAPDCYLEALRRLSVEPEDAIVIEDTAASVAAAKRAGLRVIATPGDFAEGQDFFMADLVLPALGNEDGELDEAVLAMVEGR